MVDGKLTVESANIIADAIRPTIADGFRQELKKQTDEQTVVIRKMVDDHEKIDQDCFKRIEVRLTTGDVRFQSLADGQRELMDALKMQKDRRALIIGAIAFFMPIIVLVIDHLWKGK